MVQSINHTSILKANVNELCSMIRQLAAQFPSNLEQDSTLIQASLERLLVYAHTDQVCINIPLDLIVQFLDCDDESVLNAACALLNTWIQPWSSSMLLDRLDLITLALNHQAASVRILILTNLSKLNPQEWSEEIAQFALHAVMHESVSVFDAFTSLLCTSDYVQAILMHKSAQLVIQSKLLTHRVYVFRGLELIGRAARLSPDINITMPNLAELFHHTYMTRIAGSDIDYAVFCTLFQSLLSPFNTPLPGEPLQVLRMAQVVIDHLVQQTESGYYPECGIEPMIAVARLVSESGSEQVLISKIMSIASTLITSGPVRAYTVLRTLSSFDSTLIIVNSPVLVSALQSTFESAIRFGPEVLVNGFMQFVIALAPYSDKVVKQVVPQCAPESDRVQSLVSLAIKFARHSEYAVYSIGIDALITLASLKWTFGALLRPDRVGFLLHLDEPNIELRQAKCATVKQVLVHDIDDPNLVATLTEFVRRGPFAKPTNAQVLVDKVSM